MRSLGENIASLRRERGMTQEELASVIGVSAQSVSKWENGMNMPDIMLLPVIASIFDISIDALFGDGKPTKRVQTFSQNDVPEAMYVAFLETMQRFWYYGSKEEVTEQVITAAARTNRSRLEEGPNSNTGVLDGDGRAVYGNHELALVYMKTKERALPLLESDEIAKLLRVLSGDTFRAILKYQLENPTASFTVASVEAKLGIDAKTAQAALDELVNYNFLQSHRVDIGTEELLCVYNLYGEHKMNMLLYPLLSLAERLANFRESWYGLSC